MAHAPEEGAELPTSDEARADAVKELARLLGRPEDLRRLREIREEVAARQQRADLDLAQGLQSQATEVRRGMRALKDARGAVSDTRRNFGSIDARCGECASLIDRPDLIRDLAVMRVNLGATVADAEAITALPELAAAATELLSDERALLTAWEDLTALEARTRPARAALEAARRATRTGAAPRTVAAGKSTATYFSAVDDAVAKMEASLWRAVRRGLFSGRAGCKTLVRAMRVIEEQEALDTELHAAVPSSAAGGGKGTAGAGQGLGPVVP